MKLNLDGAFTDENSNTKPFMVDPTTLNDGSARTTLALGVGYRVGRYQVDLGGGAVLAGTRDVGTGCNPVDDEGCDGQGEIPVPDRTAPDPAQPAQIVFGQEQSPFNEGEYKSSYLLFMLGVQTWF